MGIAAPADPVLPVLHPAVALIAVLVVTGKVEAFVAARGRERGEPGGGTSAAGGEHVKGASGGSISARRRGHGDDAEVHGELRSCVLKGRLTS